MGCCHFPARHSWFNVHHVYNTRLIRIYIYVIVIIVILGTTKQRDSFGGLAISHANICDN